MYFWEEVRYSEPKGGAKSSNKKKESTNSKTIFDRRVGRPTTLSETQKDNVLRAYYSRPYSLRQLADMFGVSRMTVWRTVQGSTPADLAPL